MERWQDRVALVTGASSGIGAATCRALAKNGMKVIGCARDSERIKKIAREFPNGKVHAIRCDLTKEDDILSMFEEIRSKYGRIDVCVNNAGFATSSDLLNAKTEEWRSMFEVNVLALCICTRDAIKLMREKDIDDGQIIQISSIGGHRVYSMASYYCGTKFMVRALTEGLRQELKIAKSHIRVASISPGAVHTEFAQRRNPDKSDMVNKKLASTPCLRAEDVAATVINILQMPAHVDVNDILMTPVEDPF